MTKNKDFRDYYEIIDKFACGSFEEESYKIKKKSTGEVRVIRRFNKKGEDNCLKYLDLPKVCNIMQLAEGENGGNENTIKYFESFETDDEFAIVEELYDEDLSKLLARKKTFNVEEIKKILTQLNNTFRIMGKNKIVHRDIKPETIFINYKNEEKTEYIVKLGEYYVSDIITNEYLDLTVGTPGYMAPEIRICDKYNEKCDLWSLGIVIYMLYFNEKPFKSNNHLAPNKSSDLEKLKKSSNDCLDDLIRKLLVIDPKERIGWTEYFEHPFFAGK